MAYEGWANWDTWAVNLWFANDEELYRNKLAWLANFRRKMASGKFDHEKAVKAVRLYVVPMARKHEPEIDRKAVDCGEIVDNWIDEIQDAMAYEREMEDVRAQG